MISAASDSTDDVGIVVPGFDRGSLFLKDEDGRYFRLAWEDDGLVGPRNQRRALPPGRYTLTGYRVIRGDANGDDWFISVTSKDLRPIEVMWNRETLIDPSDTIDVKSRVGWTKDGVGIFMTVQGERSSGLTIYRSGKRIPITYSLYDPSGGKIANGDMKYG